MINKKELRKTITSIVLPNPKRDRARFNMTLGSFVKALQRERKGLEVWTNLEESLGIVHAYPEYSGDVAFFATRGEPPITVAELIRHCDTIMGRDIQGPEGTITVNSSSPVWVCNVTVKTPFRDCTAAYAVIDVIADAGIIKVILVNRDDDLIKGIS